MHLKLCAIFFLRVGVNDDVDNMKNDIKKLIKKTSVDVFLLGILPSNWEEIYDKIVEF